MLKCKYLIIYKFLSTWDISLEIQEYGILNLRSIPPVKVAWLKVNCNDLRYTEIVQYTFSHSGVLLVISRAKYTFSNFRLASVKKFLKKSTFLGQTVLECLQSLFFFLIDCDTRISRSRTKNMCDLLHQNRCAIFSAMAQQNGMPF